MNSILDRIIQNTKQVVAERKAIKPLETFIGKIISSDRSLKKALSSNHSDFILECKKASPSKGLIRENFDEDLDDILQQYSEYASAISVLTDKKYFQGDFSYLTTAAKTVKQPILCKDFFVDEYQVYEARHYGADAILLMLSVLDDEQYTKLANIAKTLNLDVLTEVHDELELNRALSFDAEIIGINNRNLKDLSIDLATTKKLAHLIPKDKIIISESGISDQQDIKRLSPLVNGFLIGSSIMENRDIRSRCKELVFGKVKICGITRLEDASECDKNGATYAGFIFYEKSKRHISLENALDIVAKSNMPFVGVFVDAELEKVIEYTKQLDLHAVQLHGNESAEYIKELKNNLPKIKIWKAIAISDSKSGSISEADSIGNTGAYCNPLVDRYLVDSYSLEFKGGTGKSFNWDLLNSVDSSELILAGGIDNSNVLEARAKNTFALDLSSGVEIEPGIKCPTKIAKLFSQLRA